jgi:hypothetical protein
VGIEIKWRRGIRARVSWYSGAREAADRGLYSCDPRSNVRSTVCPTWFLSSGHPTCF